MLRSLVPQDAPFLAELAKANMPHAWSENVFQDCFKTDYHGFALQDADGKMIGFLILLCQLEECQLMNICVDQNYRRQGLGRQLVQHAIAQASQKHMQRMILEVRVSNKAAIALYRVLGFIDVGLRKDYYPNDHDHDREDALVMMYKLQ